MTHVAAVATDLGAKGAPCLDVAHRAVLGSRDAEVNSRERVVEGVVVRAGATVVRAVVDVTGVRYELVRACVDRLLSCSETDLEVTLVADWDGAGDSGLEARLVQANYLSEPRVGFAPVAGARIVLELWIRTIMVRWAS